MRSNHHVQEQRSLLVSAGSVVLVLQRIDVLDLPPVTAILHHQLGAYHPVLPIPQQSRGWMPPQTGRTSAMPSAIDEGAHPSHRRLTGLPSDRSCCCLHVEISLRYWLGPKTFCWWDRRAAIAAAGDGGGTGRCAVDRLAEPLMGVAGGGLVGRP